MSNDQLQIWLVLVGAACATIGGLVAQLIVYAVQQAGSRKGKREEKLEELLNIVYQHDNWLGWKESALVFGTAEESKELRPLTRAQAIAAAHLPELLPELNQLALMSGKYEAFMYTRARERHRNQVLDLSSGIMELYQPYMEARTALITRAGEIKL
jgi:hypothetical protein